jgi:hypothetical protein
VNKLLIDETGKRYGMLFVVNRHQRPVTNRAYWFCECDCGQLHSVLGDHLRTGAIWHCGCMRPQARPPLKPRKTKAELRRRRYEKSRRDDAETTEPHVYRTPRRIEMGPIVAAALAALEARS